MILTTTAIAKDVIPHKSRFRKIKWHVQKDRLYQMCFIFCLIIKTKINVSTDVLRILIDLDNKSQESDVGVNAERSEK